MASRVSVPFRSIAQSVRLVQVLQRCEIPERSRYFVSVLNVLCWKGDRRVPKISQDGRDGVVFEVVDDLERSVVKLVQGKDTQDRQDAGNKDGKEGEVGEDGGLRSLDVRTDTLSQHQYSPCRAT